MDAHTERVVSLGATWPRILGKCTSCGHSDCKVTECLIIGAKKGGVINGKF